MWVISPDPPDKLAGYWRDKGLDLIGLLDPKSEAIAAYGILNEAVGRVAHPSTVVIGRDGIIRYARTDVLYTRRPSVDEILAAVKNLTEPGR